MYSAPVVANNILYRLKKDVSPMKLQKLLYITYKEYLVKTGRKLFNEPFEAWRYGPVVRCVYNEFKPFGSRSITDYAKNAEGRAFIISEDNDLDLKTILDDVICRYGNKSGIELSKLTHENRDSAWKKAYASRNTLLKDSDICGERSYLR